MITRNLRFPDQTTWETKGKELGLYTQMEVPTPTEEDPAATETQWVWDMQSRTHAIDNIGTIMNDDAVYETNEETGEVTVISEATPMAGYHVNYKCSELPASLSSYEVTPKNPYRKFAGDP